MFAPAQDNALVGGQMVDSPNRLIQSGDASIYFSCFTSVLVLSNVAKIILYS